MFEHGADWHCFYFTHDDINPENSNHWKYGCHLHYVSHLWPNLNKAWVWKCFNKRATDISGSLHIRFEPFNYPHPDSVVKSNVKDKTTLPLWATIFNPNTASGCGSTPLPVAQVATRGLLFMQMSLKDRARRKR
jgi:hypothetical protein